jgi:hypothetical protein
MGTGLWNAAGYVPPLPVAWCRIYLGWENCETIDSAALEAELTHPAGYGSGIPAAYKVMISDDEYFLLENRQQNPDGSTFVNSVGDTLATFSFEIIENQQYYPEGHAYAGQPYFDFMENTYAGCEWDFYLPGYGEGDALEQEGSGICIWHIDELVMNEKFNPAEEINVPNGDETHKAIDLEEADHNQGLDLYGYYGSKDDTYRNGNNDYFGYREYNGLPWTPTAESYYGGIQLEIFAISESANVMSFSVDYEWSLDTGYQGRNTLPAAFLDFGDGDKKLFYPMPDCNLYLWENNVLVAEETILRDTIPQCWSWLEANKQILIPASTSTISSLHCLNGNLQSENQLLFYNSRWAAPPLVIENENPRIILALNQISNPDEDNATIAVYDAGWQEIYNYQIGNFSIGGMMFDGEYVFAWGRSAGHTEIHRISPYSVGNVCLGIIDSIDYELDNGILTRNGEENLKMYFTTGDSVLIEIDQYASGSWETWKEIDLPFKCTSYPSYGDLDNNGILELIYGGENGFAALDIRGNVITASKDLSAPDSSGVCAGVIPIDLDSDGKLEVAGMMSQNRLCIWENKNDNDFRMKRHYPISYGKRSRVYPLISDNVLYLPADNGKIFRDQGHQTTSDDIPVKYVDISRTAFINLQTNDNQHETSSLFVDKETYIYPNPYNRIFSGTIVNGMAQEGKIGIRVMLNKNETVKISIYDIAGNLVEKVNLPAAAYFAETYLLDAEQLASGVYAACLKAGDENKLIKFAIEK